MADRNSKYSTEESRVLAQCWALAGALYETTGLNLEVNEPGERDLHPEYTCRLVSNRSYASLPWSAGQTRIGVIRGLRDQLFRKVTAEIVKLRDEARKSDARADVMELAKRRVQGEDP